MLAILAKWNLSVQEQTIWDHQLPGIWLFVGNRISVVWFICCKKRHLETTFPPQELPSQPPSKPHLMRHPKPTPYPLIHSNINRRGERERHIPQTSYLVYVPLVITPPQRRNRCVTQPAWNFWPPTNQGKFASICSCAKSFFDTEVLFFKSAPLFVFGFGYFFLRKKT